MLIYVPRWSDCVWTNANWSSSVTYMYLHVETHPTVLFTCPLIYQPIRNGFTCPNDGWSGLYIIKAMGKRWPQGDHKVTTRHKQPQQWSSKTWSSKRDHPHRTRDALMQTPEEGISTSELGRCHSCPWPTDPSVSVHSQDSCHQCRCRAGVTDMRSWYFASQKCCGSHMHVKPNTCRLLRCVHYNLK